MPRWHWLLCLNIVILLGGPPGGWGASIVITMPPEAQVQETRLILGDVAEIQGEPADMVARLRHAHLGQAPPAGVTRLLSKSTLITQLKHQGMWSQSLQFQGAPQIRVRRASQRLDPQHMETVVRQALSRRLAQTTQRTSIRNIRGLRPVFVPFGAVEYEVTAPERHLLPGPTSFTLTIEVAGKVAKQLRGTATIAVAQEVVSLARPVAQGEIIAADAVTRTQIQVTQPLRQVLTQPEDIIGRRARRSLAGHTPLSTQDVTTVAVVHRGDMVRIVLESPLIKVSTPGEALEAGKPGDTIRVKNTTSRREVRAQVIDKQTVRIPL
jgi:flagella basal body P-ring formation protein FlgA